jgi:hypothetical protein
MAASRGTPARRSRLTEPHRFAHDHGERLQFKIAVLRPTVLPVFFL